MFLIFVSSLLLSVAFIHKAAIPIVRASFHQGDPVIDGNTVYTIEGRFDINGSIIVEGNATLQLKDAYLNITQVFLYQHNITLRNASNGNPRLLVYNSTITSDKTTYIYLMDNSSAVVHNSHLDKIDTRDDSVANVFDSFLNTSAPHDSAEVHFHNSEINCMWIGLWSANCSISKVNPGLFEYWNFLINCSVSIDAGGAAPNVTLSTTIVKRWMFAFYDTCNVEISNSTMWALGKAGCGTMRLESTSCYSFSSTHESSWFLNSTYKYLSLYNVAKVYVSWYLDVHAVDSIGQDIPSANVTAIYPNATLAESKLTDVDGWARLTLMEKMVNKTGQYPIGNYTIETTYETHSCNAAVNMTESQQITLRLEDFIFPEFPSFLILPLFMIATLLAVIAYKTKIASQKIEKEGDCAGDSRTSPLLH